MVSIGERYGLLPEAAFEIEGPDGALTISRISTFSGKRNSMTLPIDRASFDRWRVEGKLIQTVFPDLSNEEREFLMSGATQAEWDEAMGPEED